MPRIKLKPITKRPWSKGSDHQPLYQTERWKRLSRDLRHIEPLCRECARQGRVSKCSSLDHIKPWRFYPDLFFVVSNLQPLCRKCHQVKTSADIRIKTKEQWVEQHLAGS